MAAVADTFQPLAPAPEPVTPHPAGVRVFGVEFARVASADVAALVLDRAERRCGAWVVTANLDHVRRCAGDAPTRELLAGADLLVADGTPIVWASRVAGTPLPERVAGSDLIWTLSRGAAQRGLSLFLLGGAPGSADRAATILRGHAPGLRIAGTHCPPIGFEGSAAQMAEMEAAVLLAAPDVVLVGLGFPRQDRVISRLRHLLPETTFMGVGMSLGFVAGDVRRAPRWMGLLGVEWLYRLAHEPRRLWRRYLVDGLPFALQLFAAAGLARLRRVMPADGFGEVDHGA